MSSSDDLDAFERAKRDGLDTENNDQDSIMDEKLVDAEILYKKMGFDKRLPKSWVQRIESNEIDYNTASKYNLNLKKINPIFYFAIFRPNQQSFWINWFSTLFVSEKLKILWYRAAYASNEQSPNRRTPLW